MERAEDWFEQANRWGATSVESMVRLELQNSLVRTLDLSAAAEEEVWRRLAKVDTTLKAEL